MTDLLEMKWARFMTDRCFAGVKVKRNTFVPCCLKVGHKGPHKPAQFGKQTAS